MCVFSGVCLFACRRYTVCEEWRFLFVFWIIYRYEKIYSIISEMLKNAKQKKKKIKN